MAERTDTVDRAGMTAYRGMESNQPARQLILSVRFPAKDHIVLGFNSPRSRAQMQTGFPCASASKNGAGLEMARIAFDRSENARRRAAKG